MNTLRILLADDNPKVRSALRLLLEQEPGLQVAGEARDAQELLQLLIARHFDVILLDWELSRLHPTQLLRVMRTLCPAIQIVALSGRPDARPKALAAGADTFISKGDSPDMLLDVLRGWQEASVPI